MIQALGFFILGVVSDALISLHYISITRGRALMAALLTILIGGLGYFIIRRVVVTWRPDLIAAELLGCAVGTFFIVKLTRRRH